MERDFIEQHLRNRAAVQIWRAIREERNKDMKVNRSGADYIRSMLGLQYLFQYVSHLDTPTVLDCGAGNTRGISELSRTSLADGLTFRATVLRHKDAEIDTNLGSIATYRTPVETLRGIGDIQFGAVLALNSVAYSQAPELAIASIDRHLVPGGVLKATFQKDTYRQAYEEWGTYHQFAELLRGHEYDVGIRANHLDKKVDVVLALKPGATISAEELLQMDESDCDRQFHLVQSSK